MALHSPVLNPEKTRMWARVGGLGATRNSTMQGPHTHTHMAARPGQKSDQVEGQATLLSRPSRAASSQRAATGLHGYHDDHHPPSLIADVSLLYLWVGALEGALG